LAVTGVPIGVPPRKIVNVAVPVLTVPDEEVTEAFNGIVWADALKFATALVANVLVVVAVEAGVTVSWNRW
jgi:hypothetical protein